MDDDHGVTARVLWEASSPPGGWGRPWPQCAELARALPTDQWTLVGGLMVQLHSAVAGLTVSRPTTDVDIVLHMETGAATMPRVASVLRSLGYVLMQSINGDSPAHRFLRGNEQLDVMVADHLVPRLVPRIGGRKVFQVTGGTQALRRTVNCRIVVNHGDAVSISIPNRLGALVLKGAAYQEDSRDKGRHLDDAATLLATITGPLELAADMGGSDRSRILGLNRALADPSHESWKVLDHGDRARAISNLAVLCANPDRLPVRRLGR
ncbi:hypothetical protein [Arthrobacter sp. StoSoilB5]|uniref:hypothetical protein n=1 Tax=Arthrobacter sp. StoSoilB5 TaxID=2830992 RepID=UPI001CC737B9|nr:hypothetical protein [Arthrobacter sp. StoSoilB5]